MEGLAVYKSRENKVTTNEKILQLCGIALGLGLLVAIVSSLPGGTTASASKFQAKVVPAPAVPSIPVTVTNPNANPVFVEDVDNPARQPFAINMCNATNSGTACGNVPHFFTAPLGRRIVIEQISGFCSSVDSTASGVVRLDATVAGMPGVLTVLPQGPFNPSLGFGFIIPATLTRIYPDPGTDFSFGLSPAGQSGSGIVCNASLIGYTTRP